MTDFAAARKWACEYCTYENYPATKKCTLCRAPKPPQFINENAPPTIEQDIYKMAALVSPTQESPNDTPQSSTSTARPDSMPKSKWPCQFCTYLNWPRSQKCVQCLKVRPKIIPIMSDPTDYTKPLSISVNIESAGSSTVTKNSPTSRNSPRVSPRTSPNSPEAAKALNNDKNRAVAAATKVGGKWNCKACTYENWPKAPRCVLCGVPRGKTFSESAPEVGGGGGGGGVSPVSSFEQSDLNNRSLQKRRSPPASARSLDSIEIQQLGGATASPSIIHDRQDKNKNEERKLRQFRNRLRETDWLWLTACQGVVEGDAHAVEAYLASGGDTARQLTQDEAAFLNRPSAFQPGYTLVHLAIRFQREDMLAVLLTATEVAAKAKKRMPSHVSPDIAADILRGVSAALRQRKGDFPCYFFTDNATFTLPAEIDDLPRAVQKQLFDEILDRDVQKELEMEESVINWSAEITERLGSRLYALWNRTAGDCLLDSVLQATWGVFDRDNMLRRALSDSLCEGAVTFYPRWKETETMQATSLQFALDENQWQNDWAVLLSLASQAGASLEQIHIFALAHILRRPIIVYGIRFVKSFRGENIGIARFQGVYLPLLWETSFCWKAPIALGYTRGHFSALVPMEVDMDENMGAGAHIDNNDDVQVVYLPLTDNEGKVLPVHFLTATELGHEESILRGWMDCCVTDSGLLVAQTRINKRPLLVRQMLDEWLDRYRRLSHLMHSSHAPAHSSQTLSSEGETDDE